MNEAEVLKFIKMVLTYDQVGEVTVGEQDYINYINKVDWNSNTDKVKASTIEIYFSEYLEDLEEATAENLFLHVFSMTLSRLNELADEFDYQRVVA